MTRIVDPEGREARILDRLGSLDGRQVLDIGCGEGRTTRHIARTASSVLGVDPDEERIAAARRLTANRESEVCTFLAADAVTLELPQAGFDVAVFSRSL